MQKTEIRVGLFLACLGIFGIINKPSIRKCFRRIPQYVEFSPGYFSEFALRVKIMVVCLLLSSLFTACISTRVDSQTPTAVTQMPVVADILREQFDRENSIPTLTPTPLPIVSTQTPSPPSITPSAPSATLTHTPQSPLGTMTIQPSPTPTVTSIPQVQVALNAVYLRSGPSIDYPIIRLLLNGEVVEVIAVFGGANGWFNVRLQEGITGWVSTTIVQPVNAFSITIIPTVATVPATTTPTPTYTATAVDTPMPIPPRPTKTPIPSTSTPTEIPTVNPYP
jgi:uncharacterized protein YgiM (DUF1202 family)